LTLAFHRYANLFPLNRRAGVFRPCEDIRAKGLYDRIDLIEVDGAYQISTAATDIARWPGWCRPVKRSATPGAYKSGLPLTAEDLFGLR